MATKSVVRAPVNWRSAGQCASGRADKQSPFAMTEGEARHIRQRLAVANCLQEEKDAPVSSWIDEHPADPHHVDVGFIADRNQGGEANVAGMGAREQRADGAAALGNQTKPASAGDGGDSTRLRSAQPFVER